MDMMKPLTSISPVDIHRCIVLVLAPISYFTEHAVVHLKKEMFDDVAVLQQLLHSRQMALGVWDKRIDDLLQSCRTAPVDISRCHTGAVLIALADGDSDGGHGVQRNLLVERAREVRGGAKLEDSVEDALGDGARGRARVPVAHVAEEAGEVDRWHNPTDAAGARAEEEEEEPVVAGPPRNYPL